MGSRFGEARREVLPAGDSRGELAWEGCESAVLKDCRDVDRDTVVVPALANCRRGVPELVDINVGETEGARPGGMGCTGEVMWIAATDGDDAWLEPCVVEGRGEGEPSANGLGCNEELDGTRSKLNWELSALVDLRMGVSAG